jgi:hypothetical protein
MDDLLGVGRCGSFELTLLNEVASAGAQAG